MEIRGRIHLRAASPFDARLAFAVSLPERITRRFGKRLGLSTERLYLQRWGMAPQKPLSRAKARSPAAIQAWLQQGCRAVARLLKARPPVIYWSDETGISNHDKIGRAYAPKGKPAVVAWSGKPVSLSAIPAVGNRGLMRFMLHDGYQIRSSCQEY